jgi:hypothetical protein
MSAKNIKFLMQLLVVVSIATIFSGLYRRGAIRQMIEVNLDPGVTDQGAYIDYARQLYDSGYTYIGDHNRMPVYPALQSLFLQPDQKRREIFEQGKWINLYLSLPLLGGIALLLGRRFSILHTLNLMLVTGFLVFIFKAGWFQAELLFYFLNFCLFLEMLSLLQKPTYGLAILAGITAGLAHLTKASILPGLAIFSLVYALSLGLGWLRSRQAFTFGRADLTRKLLVLPLVLVVFLSSVYPYISTSKRVFGQYFYNVNSTFYIWYDSWEEAKQGTRAHGDRIGWPDMPPEQIPSPRKYLREHTPGQIGERFIRGAKLVWEEVSDSYGYLPYVLIYAGLLAVATVAYRRQAADMIRANPIPLLFVGLYFCAYLLLYFWYAPIAAGNRLILAQFLPLMYSLSSGLSALLQGKSIRLASREVGLLVVVNLAILPFILYDVYTVLTDRAGWMIGGD